MITADSARDLRERKNKVRKDGGASDKTPEERKAYIKQLKEKNLKEIEDMFDNCRDEDSKCPDDSISKEEIFDDTKCGINKVQKASLKRIWEKI